MTLQNGVTEFSPWVSTGILAGYAALSLLGGLFVLTRRDA